MTRLLCSALLGAATLSAPAATVVTVDNSDAGFTVLSGSWSTGSFPTPNGADYRFETTIGQGPPPSAEAEWVATLPTAGSWEVSTWYVQGTNRPTDAPYRIDHLAGTSTVRVNQETNGSSWVTLGTYGFDTGTPARVVLGNDCDAGQAVIADAVRFEQVAAPGPPSPEMRAMWISRFEWPSTNQTTAQNNLTGYFDDLADHNFNAAFVQVRGQADVFYPSPNEPWSPIISSPDGADPGWDPLAYMVTQAHARGLQLHAYINTHTCWQTGTPSAASYPDHLFFDHCDASNPSARDWLVHDAGGNPVQSEESGYVWMAPGVPAMQAYVREQIMYVVENYDVDGVHFDRIRTPGAEYSRDPISLARWDDPLTGTPNDGPGNPDNLDFQEWTIDQITRFNNDIYAQVLHEDRSVAVSSAPLGLHTQSDYPGYPAGFQYGVEKTNQDAVAWMQNGGQDFVCPQIYWADGGALPDWSDLFPVWQADATAAGRAVVSGSVNSNGQSAVEAHATGARSGGALGHILFSISSTSGSEFDSWLANVYPTPAPAPDPETDFPWRATEGIVLGRVYEPDGTTPVTDAWVNRTGSSWTAVSSADGLYAHLRLANGTYELTATHPDYNPVTVTGVAVSPGTTVEVDLVFQTTVPVELSVFGEAD